MLNVRTGLPFGSGAAQATTIQKPTLNGRKCSDLGGLFSLVPESYNPAYSALAISWPICLPPHTLYERDWCIELVVNWCFLFTRPVTKGGGVLPLHLY